MNITTIDLLPCPFCGSQDIDNEGWASLEDSGPACNECGATAPNSSLWNTRLGVKVHKD